MHWTWYSGKHETVVSLNMGHISPPLSPPPWFMLPTSFAQVIAPNTVIPAGLPSFPFLPIVKSQLCLQGPHETPVSTHSSSSLTLPMTAHCGRQQTSLSAGPTAGGRLYFQPTEYQVPLWLSLVSRMWWMGLASSEHEFLGFLSSSALLLEPCWKEGMEWAKENCWKRPSRPASYQSTYQQRCPNAIRTNVAFWNLLEGLQMHKPRTWLFKAIKMFLVCYTVETYWLSHSEKRVKLFAWHMVGAQGPFDKIIKKLTNGVSIPTKEASIKIISGYGQCHEANTIPEVEREQRWERGSAVGSPLAWE